jgi:hypothetical protein
MPAVSKLDPVSFHAKWPCKTDTCTEFYIFGTSVKNMGQNAPRFNLDQLPPVREKVETIEILRQTKGISQVATLNF